MKKTLFSRYNDKTVKVFKDSADSQNFYLEGEYSFGSYGIIPHLAGETILPFVTLNKKQAKRLAKHLMEFVNA